MFHCQPFLPLSRGIIFPLKEEKQIVSTMLKTAGGSQSCPRTLQLNPAELPNLEPIWVTPISSTAPVNQVSPEIPSRERAFVFPTQRADISCPGEPNVGSKCSESPGSGSRLAPLGSAAVWRREGGDNAPRSSNQCLPLSGRLKFLLFFGNTQNGRSFSPGSASQELQSRTWKEEFLL